MSAEEVAAAFDARRDAKSRLYVYQISTRKTAFAKKYVWWVKEPLDVSRMAAAAAKLAGRHDFNCFRAVDPEKPAESSIVVVESATVEREDDLILFRIEASHFLWRMVRAPGRGPGETRQGRDQPGPVRPSAGWPSVRRSRRCRLDRARGGIVPRMCEVLSAKPLAQNVYPNGVPCETAPLRSRLGKSRVDTKGASEPRP